MSAFCSPDDMASITAQGVDAHFVKHEPGIRNYNSGLTRKAEKLYLATRRANPENWRCDIVVNRLLPNDRAERICTLALPRKHGMEDFEDGRLFWHAGKLHLAYTEGHYWSRPWLSVQKLAILRDDWSIEQTVTIGFGVNSVGQEKNWAFFSHRDGRLHFVYSPSPHVVAALDEKYRVVESWATQPDGCQHLRGGTPPVHVGQHYYSFAHWYRPHPTRERRYAFCSYRFMDEPPFEIDGLSGSIVWASGRDETLPNLRYPHWAPLVVFPCGALVEEDCWLVSAGINDSFDALFRLPVTIPHDYVLSARLSRGA